LEHGYVRVLVAPSRGGLGRLRCSRRARLKGDGDINGFATTEYGCLATPITCIVNIGQTDYSIPSAEL
uniref:Leishmanolysin-like peptidase n=1 Tax=Heligmosomoides polygyrus TaxID=6339 RepID=A0A183FXT7_HELPZ